MRILLDESVPWRLGRHLAGHSFTSVQKHGWASIKNGKLLALASREFDVLLTADKGMEHQQNPETLPVAILVVRAKSNRMEDLLLPRRPPKVLHLWPPKLLHPAKGDMSH